MTESLSAGSAEVQEEGYDGFAMALPVLALLKLLGMSVAGVDGASTSGAMG